MALDISYAAAVGGGIISFLSPCVLPLVPAYLCFITGTSLEDLTAGKKSAHRAKVMLAALAFVLGFSTVFVALGATASVLSGVLRDHLDLLGKIAGGVIILFGLHFIGVFRLSFLYREARFAPRVKPPGWLGSYVIGLAFAFGWTPCIGPVLSTILTIAGSQQDVARGAWLLAVYSLGLGIPFLLAALGIDYFLSFLQRFRGHMRKVEIVAGVFLVLVGILILTNSLQVFSYFLLDIAPWLANIG
jgi:cytochrome c-type biogenesis protein